MITINVVEQPVGPLAVLQSNFRSGGFSPAQQVWVVVSATPEAVVASYSGDFDDLSPNGPPVGRMRDKSVSHAKASGVLSWAGSGPIGPYLWSNGLHWIHNGDGSVQTFHLFTHAQGGGSYESTDWTNPSGLYKYENTIQVDISPGTSNRFGFVEWQRTLGYRKSDGALVSESWMARCQVYRYTSAGAIYWVKNSGNFTTIEYRYGFPNAESFINGAPTTGGTLVSKTGHYYYGAAPSSGSAQSIISELGAHLSDLSLVDHPTDFGELAVECARQLEYVDGNVLSLFFDIADWQRTMNQLRTLTSSPTWKRCLAAFRVTPGKGGNAMDRFLKIVKNPSEALLFWKYAVLPSVSDIRRLIEGLGRIAGLRLDQRLHSRRITQLALPGYRVFKHTAVLITECGAYPGGLSGWLQKAIGFAKRCGVYPELTNLWDVLKYSFVVDWFVQFGDLFNDIQQYQDLENYFPVHHCVLSEKWEAIAASTSIVPDCPALGDVTYSYYTRWITREVPLPSISLEAGSQPYNHVVEASALIIQRL